MARRLSNRGIKIYADLSEVVQMIGAGQAMADDIETNSDYIDSVIDAAYEVTNNEFNSEAAAYAATGGRIKHMFEWGTSGINRGRTNMRPAPTSERARLWMNHLSGQGMTRNLNYTFKPSLAYVPKPTARDTGMDPDVISMLRNHIFHWKAMVMESGANVTIMPKEAKMLLMPFYNGAPPGTPPSHVRRGYSMHPGPVTFAPGHQTQGEFTHFWLGWWESQGQSRMNKLVEEQVQTDYMSEVLVNKSTGPKPLASGTIKGQVAKEKKRVQQKARAKAKARKKESEIQ